MNKLPNQLLEIENNSIEIGYHYTTVDRLKSIQQNGLKINQDIQNTINNNEWMYKAYKMAPIFMGINPQKQYGPRTPTGAKPVNWVLLKINVKGLNIAADLGTLIDHGAYVEDDGFWFKNKPSYLNGDDFTFDELEGSDKLDLQRVITNTKTFVVLQDIPVDRIKVVSYKGQTKDRIKNMLKKLTSSDNDDSTVNENTMKKLFENVGNNVFKLTEIDFNRGPEQEPDPFKDVSKQISNLRMNKPKGKELRKERYMRIASNVDDAEFNEMRTFVTDTLYEDAIQLNTGESRDEIYDEIVKAERWEIINAIDKIYDASSGRNGLDKWKADHDSPWDL